MSPEQRGRAANRKGGNFEREIYAYLADQFGPTVVRPRVTTNDVGDMHVGGLIVVEAKCYTDLHRAVRDGLADISYERENAGLPHGVVVVKRRGVADPARQLVVQELSDAVGLWREAIA